MPDLLVVGCGAAIHAVHIAHWNEVTIDTNGAANPTHTWSITDPTDVGLLKGQYPAHFDGVYFENIPANIFSNDKTIVLVMNALDQVVSAGGFIRFRTGAAGEKVVSQIKREFLRWGYALAQQRQRPLANLDARLDLAVAPGDIDDPFDLTFTKGGGARRASADI